MLEWEKMGININGEFLSNLRFTDDIILLARSRNQLQKMLSDLYEASLRVGLNMNQDKTKVMSTELRRGGQIIIDGETIEQAEEAPKKRQRQRRLVQLTVVGWAIKRIWCLRYFVILYLSWFDTAYCFNRANCKKSLGMESGGIKDEQISASTSYASTVGPHKSRLNNNDVGGAWCPMSQIKDGSREYLEIDFLTTRIVTEIATQGRNNKGRGQEYMEEYKIEYYRPKIGRWLDYQRWDGKKLMIGNTDTNTTVITRLQPAIIATKIRIVPYSMHLRTVCVRIEFYGCNDSSGLLSYTVPPSVDITGDLNDTTYDGVALNDGTLVDGLGRLADGQVGADSFTLDVGQGRGTGWVAWKNTTFPKKCVDLLFEFDVLRNFSEISIYTNNYFTKNTQIFGRAVLYFHVEGMLYETEPIAFHPRADLISQKARNISIPIPGGAIAKLIKIRLYFVQEWLMIGEVYFRSVPMTLKVPLEHLKVIDDNENEPTFDKFGNIVLGMYAKLYNVDTKNVRRGGPFITFLVDTLPNVPVFATSDVTLIHLDEIDEGSLTMPYQVYFIIQYVLGVTISLGIIVGLGYIVFVLLTKNMPNEQRMRWRRRFSLKYARDWIARWFARENNGDPENGDSAVKLEAVVIEMDDIENPCESKQVVARLTRSGHVTSIVPDHMNNYVELALDHSKTLMPLRDRLRNSWGFPLLNNALSPTINLQPHIQFHNDQPAECSYNRGQCSGLQTDEIMESRCALSPSPSLLHNQKYGRRVTFSNIDDNGGFEEYRSQRSRRAVSKQCTVGDKIENLLNNRDSLSIRDKIQVGPDYPWNIGSSDTAPRLCSEAELVHIPEDSLTIRKTFSCYVGREISICSTEKLKLIMKGVPDYVMIRAANVSKNRDCVGYFEEIRALASLRSPGLFNIIGIVTNTLPPIIVQEFSMGEDLCQLMRSSKDIMSFPSLIYIVTQICCSMRYLESMYMVHRDLAARNCIIYKNNRVKITDFAMYSNTYKSEYFHTTSGRRLPLRWMSWEAILLGRFTNASTVWSFAITAWEIFGHCTMRPYAQYTDAELVSIFERIFYERTVEASCCVIDALPKPIKCPHELYRMLKRCWVSYEEERPSFDELFKFVLDNFQTELPLEYFF